MVSEALGLRRAALLDQALLRRLALPLILAGAVLLLALPMLQAAPAPLTSDQSLYLSEGYNIATGVGPKYTSQEFINHRPPLFPALLAVPIRLAGGDPAAAYWIPKLIVLALAGATFLLGR
ncbi:MAG: hypothetical protein IH958_00125 [Chloroflexi bacterium]|nr:hypothetical protein [Chloroflexota bacterium]